MTGAQPAEREFTALVQALAGSPPPCRAVDPDTFYERHADAIRLCGDCTATVECLAYARAAGERYGVWGATDLEHPKRRPA